MIKEVTSFKYKPIYITAIQVLPDNIELVRKFCPEHFNYYSECGNYGDTIIHMEFNNRRIRFNDVIVKDKYNNYKAMSQEDFYLRYDRV